MKSIIFIIAIAFLVFACAQQKPSRELNLFKKFMSDHSRNYKSEKEMRKRFIIFKQNLAIIDQLNEASKLVNGATFAINEFADISKQEFSHMYLMSKYKGSDKSKGSVYPYSQEMVGGPIPANYDWRNHNPNPITPVKNQGQCGSCWAFSTTEEVESAWILAGHSRQILSEQQIVDCDTTDDGCDGGDTTTAYAYVIQAGGLETENSYPYEAVDQNCQFQSNLVVASIKSWYYATQTNNETQMQIATYNVAPLSICVDASSWQFYNGGIIKRDCGQNLDHCVQLTGYGTATDGTPYWWVRNSWGRSWGQSGYLQVERNKNLCGISDEATIAVASN